MNIYVGNIPYNTTESDISRLFEEYGEVLSVKLVKDFETGKLKGFGFVEMEQDAAKQAIDSLNEFEIGDRKIVVNEARQKTERRSNNSNSYNRDNRDNKRRY
jgi:RNA recognition motif-containing protein